MSIEERRRERKRDQGASRGASAPQFQNKQACLFFLYMKKETSEKEDAKHPQGKGQERYLHTAMSGCKFPPSSALSLRSPRFLFLFPSVLNAVYAPLLDSGTFCFLASSPPPSGPVTGVSCSLSCVLPWEDASSYFSKH